MKVTTTTCDACGVSLDDPYKGWRFSGTDGGHYDLCHTHGEIVFKRITALIASLKVSAADPFARLATPESCNVHSMIFRSLFAIDRTRPMVITKEGTLTVNSNGTFVASDFETDGGAMANDLLPCILARLRYAAARLEINLTAKNGGMTDCLDLGAEPTHSENIVKDTSPA